MRHLDLCSGIGGFHLAAEWTGFQTVGFSEIEAYCCQLLAEKWPEIPNYGDIRTADFSELRGGVTVLSAGVPCQPASLAGKRRGSKDDRWLWPAVLDVVGSVEPAWVIFENPPGILTLDEFGGVLLRLESLGYQVRAFSVPANAVGAKHRRQRVFIVANCKRQRLERTERYRSNVEQRAWSRSGSGEALADSDGAERRETQPGRDEYNGQETRRKQGADRPAGVCNPVAADADGSRRSEQCGTEPDGAQQSITERYMWRLTEPPLCRRTDGVQNRSHRLKALGNAVVPQQAYPFFAAIAQVERGL